MQLFVPIAIIALCASLVFAEDNEQVHVSPLIHHHSLQAPFVADWWQEGIPHWDIGGDAVVVSDRFVRITPAANSRVGYAWNSVPNEYEDWEVRLTFRIPRNPQTGADGIAFWYTAEPHRSTDGTTDTLFGQRHDFKGIGVIFDSYDNDNYRDQPSVLVLKNLERSTTKWDTHEDMRHQFALHCEFNHRPNVGSEPTEMILRYHKKTLSLRVRSLPRMLDVQCGQLTDVELPTGYYFGITASTGGMHDAHDVLSFQMRAIGDTFDNPLAPVEHFDSDADRQDRSYWSKQERKNGRER